MTSEARLEQTENGFVPRGGAWYVLNAREASWRHTEGRTAVCDFEGDHAFSQLGFNVNVLEPGRPMAMYHWEADQEDFLVLSGEALLIVEGEERALGAWDFVHCPPGVKHTILGAGSGPCVVVAVGARDRSTGEDDWGAYTVEPLAIGHGAGVERETTDANEAYARFAKRSATPYRDGWLPG